jgi:hypothetical protein
MAAPPITNKPMPPTTKPIVEPLNGSSPGATAVSDAIGKPAPLLDCPSGVVVPPFVVVVVVDDVSEIIGNEGEGAGTMTAVEGSGVGSGGVGIAVVGGVGNGVGGVGRGVGLSVILIGNGDLHPTGRAGRRMSIFCAAVTVKVPRRRSKVTLEKANVNMIVEGPPPPMSPPIISELTTVSVAAVGLKLVESTSRVKGDA